MTSFPPIDSNVLQAVIETFQRISSVVLGLTGAIFISRAALLVVQLEGANAFSSLVRDTVVLILAVTLFPFILKTIVGSSGQLASMILVDSRERAVGAIDNLLETLRSKSVILSLWLDLGSLTVHHLIRAIYSLLIGLLAIAAPLIFISGYILGQGIGVSTLGSSLLALSMWPVLWNTVGLLSSTLWPSFQDTSLSSVIFSVVVLLLQFLSPIFAVSLLRQSAPQTAIRSLSAIAMKAAGVVR